LTSQAKSWIIELGFAIILARLPQISSWKLGMKIQIDPHTRERAEERGTDGGEIEDVIKSGFSIPAKYEREGKAKIYSFQQKRHGRYYEQKRVEVFYVIRDETIITVTVYVFYGKWE
jgi:hypothetical protein